MKVKTLLTVAIILSALTGWSQAKEVEMTMQNNKGTAWRIELAEPSSKVDKAMQTQLSQSGVKAKKSKGVYQYKNIKLSPGINDSLNIYTKVESKGKENSIVYVAAQKSSGEFISAESDKELASQVEAFVYDFVGTNNFNSVDYEIHMISDSVKTDEMSSAKYMEDKKKLEAQRDEISKQITAMETTYNQSKSEAERRKLRLDELNRQKEGSPVSKKDTPPEATKQQ